MNSIENGLPLSLRFYDALEKQKRFRYTCAKGVQHNEYQYTGNCSVPPWQLIRASNPATEIDVTLICVETGQEWDLTGDCPDMAANIEITTVGIYDYITYFADHACCGFGVVRKTLCYLRVEDGVTTWYSELFWVDPVGVDLDEYYRIWIPGGIRSINPDDLRIWR